MMLRNAASFLGLCIAVTAFGVVAPAAAQAPASDSGDWVIPRTPDGRPDLQGNWSSATITPLQRPEGQDLVLSWDEVEAREGRASNFLERVSRPSDPDRLAPSAGGGVAQDGTPKIIHVDLVAGPRAQGDVGTQAAGAALLRARWSGQVWIVGCFAKSNVSAGA